MYACHLLRKASSFTAAAVQNLDICTKNTSKDTAVAMYRNFCVRMRAQNTFMYATVCVYVCVCMIHLTCISFRTFVCIRFADIFQVEMLWSNLEYHKNFDMFYF